jgi:hypothetical protein
MNRPKRRARPSGAKRSPVVAVRQIKDLVRLQLFVRAGGRCEFDGCNEYLLENALTLTRGNFAQMAHIVAFSEDGPRGRSGPRPSDMNDVDNLMLLCPRDHKEIDDNPGDYTRATLEGHKAKHEERIRHVTGLGPSRKTAVLLFKALIGGQTVTIPFDQVAEATSPRYPTDRNPMTIDLTAIPDAGAAFYETACATIKARVAALLGPEGEGTRAGHLSVFALGPIPLLVCLGRALSSKVPSDMYQRHRDTENWTWKSGGRTLRYRTRRLRAGSRGRVALVVSISGTVTPSDLPADARGATVYELGVASAAPSPTLLRKRGDLEAFRLALADAVSEIQKRHGILESIDLFPAVPAPVAVLIGRELLPKVHPKLRVFDYDKAGGGFTFALDV